MYLLLLIITFTNAYMLNNDMGGYGSVTKFNLRNNYFNKRDNIAPIDKEKAKIITYGWNFYKQPYNEINKYERTIDEGSSSILKWIPTNDKSFIKCLICTNFDKKNNFMIVNSILPNPYYINSINFNMLKDHLYEYNMKNNKNFNRIIYNPNIIL
tara:strand:+ start:1108 stop:1572 length:465 start_codon:yes stop_codon:yes gene_type:complete